ncbi:unnamed protein product [Discosporangium mesarthrocarpum]
MFLAAVARPRIISDGVWFDCKTGIWPIAKPATVNAERYKELMIDKVIPAIKARMPRPLGHTILVHQDGAKPHTGGGPWRQFRQR